ncbi:MAG: phosphoribosylanthranilate isomerase [Ignavibacteriales bacterium]|nr:phosphoribosylanthranilate isomerase [Ignavibacteriales bacterium]
MRVKICGITRIEDATFAVEQGADAIGFVFHKPSPRYVDPEIAGRITRALPFFVVKVGVFVNVAPSEVNRIVKVAGLNAAQLHGEETFADCAAVNVPVIKAFRVDDDFDFAALDECRRFAVLLDSRSEEAYGGTGETFDWSRIPEELRPNIALAGGVSVENVERIRRDINPPMVDVSSSVESAPGIKDHKKVAEFIRKAKG